VWIQAARRTGVTTLRGVAKQIETRLWGILNAMRLKVSNAKAEALNSQIRAMRVKARGYRNKTWFVLGILSTRHGPLTAKFRIANCDADCTMNQVL
jgi:transposase